MNQRYAILVLPSNNRVYNSSTDNLNHAELQCFNEALLDGKITAIETIVICGVNYLTFDCPALSTNDISFLSNLSFIFALFRIDENSEEPRLLPIPMTPLKRFDDDLLSILKFAGKTNELFTKMLVNVTLAASSFASDMTTRKLRVLDPVCGRGTTLNQALMYGYDTAGMEIDSRDFDAYSQFINRWLKEKRLKHKSETVELRKEGKTQAHRLGIRLAASKEQYKADNVQVLDFVLADTVRANEFFKKASFDLIVADLPYGVRHGNKSTQGHAKSPIQLLQQTLPVWATLLKRGGAIGLAWNTYLAKKTEIIKLLETEGLNVHPATISDQFRHRVDQAIIRDILVATRR
ncbi:MAG: TRM11 family methyltransferase [Granulosicoccus sp.]